MRSWRSYLGVHVMVLCIWIVGFAVYQMQPFTDPDTPWHYATGLYILSHHVIPTADPFSWTMFGKPWVTQEWLFETVFAWLGSHAGFAGSWAMLVLIHTVTVFVLYRICLKASGGNRVMAAVAAVSGTLPALIFWTMRPQTVSYMMFAVFLLILTNVREGKFWTLLWVPPLMMIWANAHGSSSIGIVLLVLEIVVSFIPSIGRFERRRLPRGARWRLLLAAAAGALFGLYNPNGLKAYTYALLSTNQLMVDNINEWHSPNFHSDVFKYGILPYLCVVFLLLLASRRRLPLRETLYFGGSFAMMLIYQRFLPYVTILASVLVAELLSDFLRALLRPTRWMLAVNGAVILAALGYLGWNLPQVRGNMDQHFSPGAYPVAAVTYMQQHHLTDHVLNAYHWGGYLIYRGVPTFVDGRTDIFLQDGVFADYLSLKNVWLNAPDLIDTYHFKVALFPSGYPILTYLTHNPEWTIAYSDGTAEVLVRTPVSSQ